MIARAYEGSIDYERLGRYFRALGVPTRVLLLHKLQWPRTPTEIRLPAFRRDAERRADRTLSRQAVESHLKKLEEVGLVRSRSTLREGQPAREYLVNAARLFVVVDEFRRLSLLQPAAGVGQDWSDNQPSTVEHGAQASGARLPDGPALVMVSGPYEGHAYALEGDGPWILGRAEDAAIPIGYDPYVSGRNSELRRDGDRVQIRSLPGSSNGTTVNWRRLGSGEKATLGGGDTIGVGRSLLVYREGRT